MSHYRVEGRKGVVAMRTTDHQLAYREADYQARQFGAPRKPAKIDEVTNRCGRPMRGKRGED